MSEQSEHPVPTEQTEPPTAPPAPEPTRPSEPTSTPAATEGGEGGDADSAAAPAAPEEAAAAPETAEPAAPAAPPTPTPTPTPTAPPATPTPAPTTPEATPAPTPTPTPTPAPAPPRPGPGAAVPAPPAHPTPTPAAVAPATPTPTTTHTTPMPPTTTTAPNPHSNAASFGRVGEDGTVYVRTPEGEREVGSYPGATPQEALAYFARKYDEVDAAADLLLARVTQTDLSGKEAADALATLRKSATDLHAVGDLVALAAKVENIATAVQARRAVEAEQKSAQRAEALAAREKIVAEAEQIAAQPENKVQWKQSSTRMRALLDEWKDAQKNGPRLDRDTEQALWHRLSSSRNSFDKMRRVHFAQLGAVQAEAKAAKEALVAEAEKLKESTEWGATAGAFKRLMDRWRQAGRAARADDDALWARFKAAQDAFFAGKDEVSAAENEEYAANLKVKEELLAQAQHILPVTDLEKAKAALRGIQAKWDAAGKVPRGDMERVEKGMRRIEAAVREAEDKKWKSSNPEVAARAASLAAQAEAALERYRRDLEKAERTGDERKIATAREALEAREAWLAQAQAGMAEFGR